MEERGRGLRWSVIHGCYIMEGDGGTGEWVALDRDPWLLHHGGNGGDAERARLLKLVLIPDYYI